MSSVSFDFSGHGALVTGAGAGIGRAVALALGAAGAAVVCADINPDRADDVADAIRAAGGRALAQQGDVANRFQMAAMIEAGREAFGKIDILVNAAGVYKRGELLTFDEWDWRRVLDVNMTGTFFALQLLARVMGDEGGGAIVNIASDAAYPVPIREGVAYAASKSGVVGMSLQAAHELASKGVRVNAVCPGDIAEEDGTPSRTDAPRPPKAIVPLILFLCSDAARGISGQRFQV
jgi:NAD(P)-dependent dehydrogenase (short-subunit alcohol dehydrogenase family)